MVYRDVPVQKLVEVVNDGLQLTDSSTLPTGYGGLSETVREQ